MYQKAKDNRQSSVDVDMFIEIDGVTNGPFINYIQTGLNNLTEDEVKNMERGGLFLDGTTSYGDWKSRPDSMDMYEMLAKEVIAKVEAGLYGGSKAQKLLLNLYAKRKGRNLTKGPLTVSNYSSSERGIADKVGSELLKEIFSVMNKAVVSRQLSEDDKVFLQTVNKAFGANIPLNSPDTLRTYEMDSRTINNITKYGSNILGSIINDELQSSFNKQQLWSEHIVTAGKIMFAMLKPRYDQRVEELLAKT